MGFGPPVCSPRIPGRRCVQGRRHAPEQSCGCGRRGLACRDRDHHRAALRCRGPRRCAGRAGAICASGGGRKDEDHRQRARSSGGRGAHLGRGVRELDAHASTEIAEVAASVTCKEAETRHDASFACAHEQRLLAEGAHDLGRVPRRYADWAALHRIAEIAEIDHVPTDPRLRCHEVPTARGWGLSLGGVACWYSCRSARDSRIRCQISARHMLVCLIY